ncbi:hypothetical protein C7M61_002666 [Candidozyma pseudohaemuli]|uniref:Uncharacterized protein n=1 Tax=Candidozyma pseudohaemuli TaxID=418784 RepID=A0A2P7YRY6_9ASCO|nr:hypothetical protein C7M61_002666 [[Candida] pseudohaemulonii]PSK38727.1 hypothetical protein C7M61_002666 [[Candida] pseudohaemulonii]
MLLAADVEFSRRYSLAVFKKRRQKEARKRLRKYIRGVLRREREMNIILQRFRQKEFQLMKTLLQDRANVLKDLLKIDDNFEGPAEQVKRSLERFDENGMSMLVDYYDAQNLDRQQILHEYRLMSQLSSQARPDDQSEAYKFLIEAFGLRKLNIAKFAASATIALRFVLDTGEEENKEGATKQEDGQKESTNVTLHKSFAILALGVAVVRGVICFTDLLNLLYRAARVSFIDYKLNSLVATYFRLETVPPKLCTELIIKAVMLCNSEGVSKSRIEKLLASGEEEQENDVAAQGSQTGGVKSGNDIVQDVAAIFAHGFL